MTPPNSTSPSPVPSRLPSPPPCTLALPTSPRSPRTPHHSATRTLPAHFPSAVPALHATILHFPASGPTISLLLSSLNVGFLKMNVQTCALGQPLASPSPAPLHRTHVVTEPIGRQMPLGRALGLQLTRERLTRTLVKLPTAASAPSPPCAERGGGGTHLVEHLHRELGVDVPALDELVESFEEGVAEGRPAVELVEGRWSRRSGLRVGCFSLGVSREGCASGERHEPICVGLTRR